MNTTTEYSPSDLTFYLQVYRDYGLARGCLARLRSIYPKARIVVASDGDPDPRYRDFVARFGVEYTEGERLYGTECGGRMIHRILELFLQKPTAYLIKIDPDTRIDRTFAYMPMGRALFGTLQPGGLQGGCLVFPADVCRELYDSKVFLDDALTDPDSSWVKTGPTPESQAILSHRAHEMGMIGFDWVLVWACRRLEIPMLAFEEVHSLWKHGIPNRDLRYAVVHPDREIHVPTWVRPAWRLWGRVRRRLRRGRSPA